MWMRFVQSYPGQVAQTLGCAESMFHDIRAQQEAQGPDPWAPFADAEEWGLVKWLVSHVGQNAIDEFMKLPILKRITVQGNKLTNNGQCETEDLELWLRDPVDCIRKLMANPEFDCMVSYAPERVFADVEGKTRRYDEMWTGDWWWEMQGRLPQGATSLSQFRGDQEVWPVYLSLGNISKDIQCQPSKHATVLIAYLPISKLECFMRDTRSVERYHLFHYCMSQVLEPLVRAGMDGVDVTCPDRQVRRMYPIVAAYIADFPEQCLCVVGRHKHGDMRNLHLHHDGEMGNEQFEGELGLQAIYSPFWATLPHNDIFSCITPDILHQLHKGVFKDHICVFLGVIAGAVDHKVLTAVHGYRTHTEDTLAHMHAALASFHANKNIFINLGARQHFNIPKIHSMMHYINTIRILGSADGFNTELPERLHIDFAKWAHHASNRCDYVIQMTTWLR
ncbi:hypothetical protein F4604DRAFT_1884337 [Suillus subluteus]|nr:hypothetical protein F4604DRAFT_1884337 [Suillus subluteus]